MRQIETVIVGGGQAGLATSYYLKGHGRDHIVLERAEHAANTWRNDRWDSFTLVTPNWALRMPGAEYDGADRDAFMPRDEVVAYFDRYVEQFQLPVQCNTRVVSIDPDSTSYRVQTQKETLLANNVVMATGYEQHPKIPAFAAGLPDDIVQLHSGGYRNPELLPAGAVLVVGSAQSGCQIAEELYQRGRKVFLCTGGSAGRAPRRYRGKDTFAWLYQIGFFDLTPEKMPFPRANFAAPHLSGANGGHTLNLHQFARDGVTLLGHIRGASGDKISVAPDLHENLERIDAFEIKARTMIDGYIKARGIDAPDDELLQMRDGYDQPILETLDLREEGITCVIWATGYSSDYSLVKLPLCDHEGFPIQNRGVTEYPGLYFVGIPWMPSLKTGTLAGVGEAAEHVAVAIARAGTKKPVVITAAAGALSA
jgi:putative flavoprotein involved in K+ transport